MASEEIWQKRMTNFYKYVNPERDCLGIYIRPAKTQEFKDALKFYKQSSPDDLDFLLKMVAKLQKHESTNKHYAEPFNQVKTLLYRIKSSTLTAHAERISELLVRLDRQLEANFYRGRPRKCRAVGPSFRWSFRHIMMHKCMKKIAPRQIEAWMRCQENRMMLDVGLPEMEALEAYARH